jgi:hypothetical protein
LICKIFSVVKKILALPADPVSPSEIWKRDGKRRDRKASQDMDKHQEPRLISEETTASLRDLVAFCNRITPPNWHVTSDEPGLVFQGPGTLNILVKPMDHFIDGWIYAFKKGFMTFHPVSAYVDRYSEARLSFKKHGEHFVGESEIWLYPDGCGFFGDNLYAATVHELAHVAVDRWWAYKQKAYRWACKVQRPNRVLHHGQVFCKAFETIIRRVDRLSENPGDLVQSLVSELAGYQTPPPG